MVIISASRMIIIKIIILIVVLIVMKIIICICTSPTIIWIRFHSCSITSTITITIIIIWTIRWTRTLSWSSTRSSHDPGKKKRKENKPNCVRVSSSCEKSSLTEHDNNLQLSPIGPPLLSVPLIKSELRFLRSLWLVFGKRNCLLFSESFYQAKQHRKKKRLLQEETIKQTLFASGI